MPTYVDIKRNKQADSLANEARKIEPIPLSTTVFDANVITKSEALCKSPEKILN